MRGRASRARRIPAAILPRAEGRDAPLAGAAADVDGGASFENIEGVRLYRGVPGEGTGHLVHEQSYFDRFWGTGRQDRTLLRRGEQKN